VGDTLDLIERLAPQTIIPGHGPAFSDLKTALTNARKRLDGFVQQPEKHSTYAAKVLLKFKLLEAQSLEHSALVAWADTTPYFRQIFTPRFADRPFATWVEQLTADLVRSGAAVREVLTIKNVG
jgi:hypothetical protein